MKKNSFTIICLAGLLLLLSPPLTEGANSSRDRYINAEACYKKLRHDSAKQTFRSYWMNCIDKFQEVYRKDPEGPWAAAGLYMTGTLYNQLYRRSGRTADRQEAIDHFERIVHRFPKSKYVGRAQKAIAATESTRTPTRTAVQKQVTKPNADTKKRFDRATACFERLRNTPSRQKYRDAWLSCIEQFDTAYRKDPAGDWAAESLYMNGTLYYELYKRSSNSSDRQNALDRLQRVVTQYPEDDHSAKAQAAIRDISGDGTSTADFMARDSATMAKTSTPTGEAVITGMRFWSNPNYTRLVIDADQETKFEYNLLNKDPSIDKPQRLYVDLHNSRLGKGLDKIIPINDDLLRHARAGQYSSEMVRVVVDIKSLASYDVFSLKEPFRIVMDIKGGEGGSETLTRSKPGDAKIKIDPKSSTSDIAKQLSLGVRRIVIDPGHGGKDYGAPGCVKGVHEKQITLQIAKRLAAKLKRELNCEVILTRTKDRYLTLEERTAFANTKDADLFISIHTNASRDQRAYGISTYFLNLADDDEAKRVAAMENATSTNNISDLEKILFSLMHYSKINESSRLATTVQDTMTHHLNRKGYSRIKSKGVKQAPFYVLLGAQMPSILVETSFISNPRECRRLMNSKYQDRLSEGIIQGIKQYIKDTNPTALFEEQPDGRSRS
jgi:N-acetylmuramoyl-L-alanine amidase